MKNGRRICVIYNLRHCFEKLPAHSRDFSRVRFHEALDATAAHRGSSGRIRDRARIMEKHSGSETLRDLWLKHRRQFPYAREICNEEIMGALRELLCV